MVYPYELIVIKLKIKDSTIKNLVGLEGKIIDETQNCLILSLNDDRKVKIFKTSLSLIEIKKNDVWYSLSGPDITGRIWDRVRG